MFDDFFHVIDVIMNWGAPPHPTVAIKLTFYVGDPYKPLVPLLLGGETSQILILILFSILLHPSKQLSCVLTAWASL